jgi:predicted HTH transcriptional regulator
VTDPEFAELLFLQHELPGVEFKAPGPRGEKTLFHSVVRAVLGMANRRDGGRIVLGVREDEVGKLELVGLTQVDAGTWRNDHLAEAIAPYADPYVGIQAQEHVHEDKLYVLIEVHEFEEVPVICRRSYPPTPKAGQKPILRTGAIYVRTRRKPETSEPPGQTEMRELIELATEKRMRSLLGTLGRAGLEVASPQPRPEEKYQAELPDDLR